MPQTVTLEAGEAPEIEAGQMQVGKVYVLTRCPGGYRWRPGDVVIKGHGQVVSPRWMSHSTNVADIAGRELLPGETVTIRG